MTDKTSSDVMALVAPKTAARFGRGRSALLEARHAGLVQLPAACRLALTALGHAERARQNLQAADPGLARADYAAKVLADVRGGADVPPADEVEVVEMRARLHGIQAFALDQARQQLHNELEAALADGDDLTAGYVRPALAALYAEAGELFEKHGPVLAGPAEPVVGAAAAVARAWSRFGIIASDVSTLRGVQFALTEETCGHDHEGVFAIYRDDPRDGRIWGQGYGARHHTTSRPWPTGDVRAYLGWLLANRLDVWVPTGPQRDERWLEMFKPVPALAALGGPGADIGRWA